MLSVSDTSQKTERAVGAGMSSQASNIARRAGVSSRLAQATQQVPTPTTQRKSHARGARSFYFCANLQTTHDGIIRKQQK